ncbi:hypothetical protein SAMN06272775_5140 [Streptomyces sp. 2323.1]|uniref:hypothetical protein n=1 Tax=Streptomyces sp. 2323.1 TaxID=1938841 RepID=UPI000BB8FB6E|nr:hypothetical protein [Streptomyces sp. 2323.1]SOE14181.1 hypothetical protein SAMN06272775_5140 [Streptomyces sp. 2323.1]
MNTTPSDRSRLQRFLRAGTEELETTLHASTDLNTRLSAALTPPSPATQDTPGPSSRLNRALHNGETELRDTLARSTDIEQHLTSTLFQASARSSDFPGVHHIA